MVQLHAIEKKIVGGLKSFSANPLQLGSLNRQWTKGVKTTLHNLGKKAGFKVCASGLPGLCEEEWLYDLVWYRYHPGSKFVREIALIAECEWSWDFPDIKDDFEKLLVGRSPYRLMIFQAGSRKAVNEYFKRLITSICKFRGTRKGDRYLFAGWDDKVEQFVFEPFVV